MASIIQRTETVTKVIYTFKGEDNEIELSGAYSQDDAFVELAKIHKANVEVQSVKNVKRVYKMPFDQFKQLASVEVK